MPSESIKPPDDVSAPGSKRPKAKQIPNTCDSILSQARWICGDLLSRGNYDRDAEGKIEVFKDMAFGGEDLAEHAIET